MVVAEKRENPERPIRKGKSTLFSSLVFLLLFDE